MTARRTARARHYAIVPTRGRYGSGARVHAVATTDSRDIALEQAGAFAKDFRETMRPFGESSGGYRVIESTGQREWLGVDLHRIPSVKRGAQPRER